jgi:hypothetical protein
MLMRSTSTLAVMLASTCLAAGCQAPTTPSAALPFDTRPRITAVDLGAPAPRLGPVPVNVQGAFFLDGLSLTVRSPDAQFLHFGGQQIRGLTRSSFEVQVPLAIPGVYYFSVQNERGLSSHPFVLPIAN